MRTLLFGFCLAAVAAGPLGCQTAHYYQQAISGEYQILSQRQSLDKLSSDPAVDPTLKAQFDLVKSLRAFAREELHLPIDKHYLTYVDLHRRFAVWNVHAAPELSLEPKSWWYPFVGSLKYRGFFSEEDARKYAHRLEEQGYDIYVEGVEAYSTLGWFADPLLNTFLNHPEPDLADIIFHELAHQRLFFSGDTDFNEAFATVVAAEGVRRWFLHRESEPLFREYLQGEQRSRDFVALILKVRTRLAELFNDSSQDAALKREEKTRTIAGLRNDYQALKRAWDGYSGYDRWFALSLNNAQLNTVALYYDLVPGFQELLHQSDGHLQRFYSEVRELKKLSKEDRHRRLHELAQAAGQRQLVH